MWLQRTIVRIHVSWSTLTIAQIRLLGNLPPMHAKSAGLGSLWADSTDQTAEENCDRTSFKVRTNLFDVSRDGQGCNVFCWRPVVSELRTYAVPTDVVDSTPAIFSTVASSLVT